MQIAFVVEYWFAITYIWLLYICEIKFKMLNTIYEVCILSRKSDVPMSLSFTLMISTQVWSYVGLNLSSCGIVCCSDVGDWDGFILRDIGGIVSLLLLYVETKGVSRSLCGCGGGLEGIDVGVEMWCVVVQKDYHIVKAMEDLMILNN